MADNKSSPSDGGDAVQDQLLNEPVEQSTSKRAEAVSPAAKFTAKHLMRRCPYTVAFDYIDTSLWGIPTPEDADETHATTWVAKTVHDYHKVERSTLKSLKTVLRRHGVYTGNNRARVADSLFNLLGGENPPEWDPVEFQATKFDERSEAYQR
ncbi:hypothetical protein BDW02DRAFT_618441 [Decorospora gaudefroyi]|uniref:Uncharacterized protein n=1 Tax=Decorospora gaudefroyi TaxID=184978 RepID=A0A6A5JWG9_9PLEO|nr:hypothetical protein BDW02DRAFT_618441 [Decorospora gaudefroyi]